MFTVILRCTVWGLKLTVKRARIVTVCSLVLVTFSPKRRSHPQPRAETRSMIYPEAGKWVETLRRRHADVRVKVMVKLNMVNLQKVIWRVRSSEIGNSETMSVED